MTHSEVSEDGDEERRHPSATLGHRRTILAIMRTYTSAVRLLEVLSIFQGDDRIEIIFTIDKSSPFEGKTEELLSAQGIRVEPWDRCVKRPVNLVMTASENVDTRAFGVPILVLSHGIGFSKYVPNSCVGGSRRSGVVPVDRLVGEVLIAISHPDFCDQIRADHPEAAERCVVIGDPAYDRMLASLRQRDQHRRSLSVGERTLVVLSSTWKEGSLLGARRDLPLRLLEELPRDEYAVALILHPNVWSWHSRYEIERCLGYAREAGLMLIAPDEGWQGALIAADIVIGDHGSVTLYGAALDKPLLLAAMGNEVVVGTPPRRLAETADWLDLDRPLRVQVEKAIATHEQGRFDEITAGMFAHRGEAASRLSNLVYELLDLPPRSVPSPRTVSTPRMKRTDVVSFMTFTRIDARGNVDIWRYPACLQRFSPPETATGRHLLVSEEESNSRLHDNASIIVSHRILDVEDAYSWLENVLNLEYRFARLAATRVENGYLVRLRDGRLLNVDADVADPGLVASAVYAHVREESIAAGSFTVRAGATEAHLNITFQ
jgi:hypothetical protein